jgi:putative ABC transport system substrate-binding protein
MRRREFIGLVGGAALALPSSARAQRAPVRIGFLYAGYADSLTSPAWLSEIGEGLRDNGLIESRDYVLELRFAAGRYDRLPALELAQAGVKMILANTSPAVRAAQGLMPPFPGCHGSNQRSRGLGSDCKPRTAGRPYHRRGDAVRV